mgnify:CR=1 FL=1
MKKRILSLALVFAIMSSLLNVAMAAGENHINVVSPLEKKYPTTDITPEFVKNNFLEANVYNYAYSLGEAAGYDKETLTSGTVVLPADENRAFTVTGNGKTSEFLLLDKDENGNYFIADKTPTKHGGWRYWDMDGEDKDGVDPSSQDVNEWNFDIDDANPKQSFANFLNNSFLNNDNYRDFPKVMLDYLVEKDWAVGADSAVDYTGEQSEWSTAKRTANPEYTTRGKMAILSAQEYLTYLDILGYEYNTYLGTALRTPASIVRKNGSGETVYECGPMSVLVQGSHVWMRYGYQPKNSRTNIQKCFWLDKDFFKEVKLDLTKTGSSFLRIHRPI